jgi:hypothetical protein
LHSSTGWGGHDAHFDAGPLHGLEHRDARRTDGDEEEGHDEHDAEQHVVGAADRAGECPADQREPDQRAEEADHPARPTLGDGPPAAGHGQRESREPDQEIAEVAHEEANEHPENHDEGEQRDDRRHLPAAVRLLLALGPATVHGRSSWMASIADSTLGKNRS